METETFLESAMPMENIEATGSLVATLDTQSVVTLEEIVPSNEKISAKKSERWKRLAESPKNVKRYYKKQEDLMKPGLQSLAIDCKSCRLLSIWLSFSHFKPCRQCNRSRLWNNNMADQQID